MGYTFFERINVETWKQNPKEPRLECSTLGNVRELETRRQVLPKRLLNKMGDEVIAHTFPDGSHFRGATKCLVWTTFYRLTHGCRHNIIHANNDPRDNRLSNLYIVGGDGIRRRAVPVESNSRVTRVKARVLVYWLDHNIETHMRQRTGYRASLLLKKLIREHDLYSPYLVGHWIHEEIETYKYFVTKGYHQNDSPISSEQMFLEEIGTDKEIYYVA